MEEAKAMFTSHDPELRRQAVMEFAMAGSVRPLLQAISDSDWRVRKTAVDALVDIGGEEVFEGLFNALFSEDNAGARNSAAEAFVKTGPQAAASLCKRLSEPDADVRKFIVDIIGEIADKSSISDLIGMLDDEDENVRASVIEHLGKMKAVEALDRLVHIMRTEDQWLAFTAAAALGEIEDKRAVAPLIEAAADIYLREAALDALCRISDESAWDVFLEYLSDSAQVIRQVAVKGLSRVLMSAPEKGRYIDSLKNSMTGDTLSFLSSCLQEEDRSSESASSDWRRGENTC
jgi:HEAT repeat protein